MIYPALQIGTQWVAYSHETPKEDSGYWIYVDKNGKVDGTIEKSSLPPGWFSKLHDVENYKTPIAAFPKLEGVPLIPEVAFRNEETWKTAYRKRYGHFYERHPMGKWSEDGERQDHFHAGFEAAGGYTESDVLDFAQWIAQHVRDKDRIFDSMNHAFREYQKEVSTITAFDCEENPDGSLKIENDTIVLKNIIR